MIWRFAYRRYRLPFRVSMRTGQREWPVREGLLLRLEDENVAVGYGEAAMIPWFGTETVDEAEAACLAFGAGIDDKQIVALPVKLPCLRNALAAARAEIEGRDGRPARPLQTPDVDGANGPASRPSLPRSLPMAALLPAGRAALAAAGPKAEAGFRIFKWKVGVGDIAEELGLLDDLCAVLPAGSKLRLDANGAWDRRQAERWLERCAERPVEFVEQPAFVPHGGTSADGGRLCRRTDDLLLGLANDYPTPVGLDESLVSDGDVNRWLGMGWPGIFVVKPSLFGDAPATIARLAKAKAAVVFSSALETAVGARTSLRAAFAWPGDARALGFGVWPLFGDARFDGPAAAPFLYWKDVERMNPEAVWNALS